MLSCKHRAPAAWEAGTRSVGLPAPIRSSALAAGARAVGWQLPAPHSSWQRSPAGTWGAPSRTNFAFFVFANFFSSSLSVLIALLCWGHLGLPLCQILLFQLVVYLARSTFMLDFNLLCDFIARCLQTDRVAHYKGIKFSAALHTCTQTHTSFPQRTSFRAICTGAGSRAAEALPKLLRSNDCNPPGAVKAASAVPGPPAAKCTAHSDEGSEESNTA